MSHLGEPPEGKLSRWRVEKKEQLAHFLKTKLGISGKAVRRLLEKNCCKVNQKIERFGSAWLETGNIVEFTPPQLEKSYWKILFENEDFQIVDKPVNWVCSQSNCQKTFHGKLFLVHRLDKDTTGALILAKTNAAKEALIALFASREIEKKYLAFVDGIVREDGGSIQNRLAPKRSYQGQTIWGASQRGDLAITHWSVLKRGPDWTLVCCEPLTGRTHQIRVHMAEMGHPILGDRQYSSHFKSKTCANRPLLHAHSLRFLFKGEEVSVLCPPPSDFINY